MNKDKRTNVMFVSSYVHVSLCVFLLQLIMFL